MHWTYVFAACMNIHVFYDCSEYPTAEHFPCHSCHALVKNCRTCSVDRPGRLIYCKDGFARGRTQLHMQMCPGGHNCIIQQRPGGHDCICKTVRRTLLHMQYCPPIILHRGRFCMRHRQTNQITYNLVRVLSLKLTTITPLHSQVIATN